MFEFSSNNSENSIKKVLWGIFFIAIALLLLLSMFGIIDFTLFFDGWWTFFIIIPAVAGLVTGGNRFSNALLLFIGVGLFLSIYFRDSYDIDFYKIVLVFALLMVGVRLIFSSKKSNSFEVHNSSKTSLKNGKQINAIFGGSEIDMRHDEISGDIYISCFVFCGGIEFDFPTNVNVVATGTSIFGGTENKHHNTGHPHTIYIEYICLLGGIDIR